MKVRAMQSALVLALAAVAPLASAYEKGDWLTRVGYAAVSPDASSSSAALGTDTVDVDDGASLGFSFTYMLAPAFGVEVLAALPFTHDIVGAGALAPAGKLGETQHLPPTVTLQWYPQLKGNLQPYVGAGLNYTTFFNEETTAVTTAALGGTTSGISLDDSFGLALQAGVDYKIGDKWLLNAAVWNIDIETTATLTSNGVPAATVDVAIDPWVYMVGAGYRF